MPICPYCKKEYIKNNQEFKDICIDGYSKNHLFEHLDSLFEYCEGCEIVTDDLTKFTDQSKRLAMGIDTKTNTQYISILRDDVLNKLEKKMLASKVTYDNNIDCNSKNNNINICLFLYYKEKGMMDVAKIYIEQELTKCYNFIKEAKEHPALQDQNAFIEHTFDQIIKVIEFNRQIGNFEEAMKYIDILKDCKFTSYERTTKAIIQLEKKMCKKKNSDRLIEPQKKEFYVGVIE